jgi:hypothetical protein
MDWLLFIVLFASMPLSFEMARQRNRSGKAWLWVAAFVGPLAPIALLLLGDARRSVPAN